MQRERAEVAFYIFTNGSQTLEMNLTTRFRHTDATLGKCKLDKRTQLEALYWYFYNLTFIRQKITKPLPCWIKGFRSHCKLENYLSIQIFLSSFINLPIYLYHTPLEKICSHLSIYQSIYLSIYLSINLSIYLSIYQSIYLSINPSIYQSIYLSHLIT